MSRGTSIAQTSPPAAHPGGNRLKQAVLNAGRSESQASAEPVEAVLADVAAQRNHADAAQYKIDQPAMRPPYVGLTALWTFNSHGWQSPEHPRPRQTKCFMRLPLISERQERAIPKVAAYSLSVYQ